MAVSSEQCAAPLVTQSRLGRLPCVCAFTAWLVLLIIVLAVPGLIHSQTAGDDLTRWTIRLSILYYGFAGCLMLLLHGSEWEAASWRGRLARLCWTLAWASYLVHLAMAFHHYHHWSHADAVEHTREVSGVGEGIYVSHLFTLLWTADVIVWWSVPHWYAGRSAWIDRALHTFMGFVIFNGTVVFEQGPVRWTSVGLFAVFGVVLLVQATRSSRQC